MELTQRQQIQLDAYETARAFLSETGIGELHVSFSYDPYSMVFLGYVDANAMKELSPDALREEVLRYVFSHHDYPSEVEGGFYYFVRDVSNLDYNILSGEIPPIVSIDVTIK